MKAVVLALLACLAGSPVSAQSLAPSSALIAGSAADLVTTLRALHSIPGATEANPLLSRGGTAGLVLVKVGTTATLIYAIHKLMPQHPKVGAVIGYLGGGTLGLIALRNGRLQ